MREDVSAFYLLERFSAEIPHTIAIFVIDFTSDALLFDAIILRPICLLPLDQIFISTVGFTLMLCVHSSVFLRFLVFFTIPNNAIIIFRNGCWNFENISIVTDQSKSLSHVNIRHTYTSTGKWCFFNLTTKNKLPLPDFMNDLSQIFISIKSCPLATKPKYKSGYMVIHLVFAIPLQKYTTLQHDLNYRTHTSSYGLISSSLWMVHSQLAYQPAAAIAVHQHRHEINVSVQGSETAFCTMADSEPCAWLLSLYVEFQVGWRPSHDFLSKTDPWPDRVS